MNVLGIDEAGRGPVLGPIVVAGIIIPDDKIKVLERMGIKDSKRLTPRRRTILSKKLKNMFNYEIVQISAKDIDEMRDNDINLNEIERRAIKQIIKNLISNYKIDKIILDSLDVKPKRLKKQIEDFTDEIENNHSIDIVSEHKADDNYLQVSAASVLAKNHRDECITKLKKEYLKIGDIGSGYPSDPKTKEFLKNFTYNEMPEIVRKSWKTVEKMK
ncbi:ribonuclease HII [Methanobrevibacter curvatus]|uniref:Ribonuclease HII n=1 Tax=Methanobrevibacter curvatus TaxID=49547 RepID=A0A166A4P0_9EURY|nr:ribonuclease HII [Methanobrevibacter curvatus]KZX11561.1 ribonuclease HII [Methanobrevibacter curvatus]